MLEHEWKLTLDESLPGGPDAFFAHVAGLTALAGYRVVASKEILLDDTYLDLPGLPIAHARAGLRLRNQGVLSEPTPILGGSDKTPQKDGTLLLTWKQEEAARDGEFRREEFEAPLDAVAWAEVQRRAAAVAIVLPAAPADMAAVLRVICQRTQLVLARPDRRLSADPAQEPVPVAKLCLDRVEYGGKPGRFYDVEIELTGAGEPGDGRTLVRALQSLTGPDWLTPSKENKLARGLQMP